MAAADETGGLREDAAREALARAMHESYVREQRAKGDGSNPSLVPWEEADESLKASNRRFAEGIGAKLRAAGCVVRPASPGESTSPSFEFTEEEVEALAPLEHDRWSADLIRDGWRRGAVKDAANKEHPLLVPWSELSEEDRDKDRDAVRNVPRILLEAGFTIERA